MSNKLVIKRSSVPGKVPTVDQLDFGEFAVNLADNKVYMKFDVQGTGITVKEITSATLVETVAQLTSDLAQLRQEFDSYVSTHP